MSVILQDIVCSVNIQHNCIDSNCTNTAQQPVYQERTLTSRSRSIVQHKLTPHYFLNAYSIHNYDYICLVTPDALRETPLRVTDVAEVRALAVRQMREKRAAKKSRDVPQQGEGGQVDNVPAPHAVFEHAPTTVKIGAKPKAKASSSSVRGRKKTAPSCTSQAVVAPPGPASPLQRNAPDAAAPYQRYPAPLVGPSSAQPMYIPPQFSHHPEPQLYIPPPQSYHFPPPMIQVPHPDQSHISPQISHHPLQPHLPAPQSRLPPPQLHVPSFPSAPIMWHPGHQTFSHPPPIPHFHHMLPPNSNTFPLAGPQARPGPQPPQHHYHYASSISPFLPAPYATQHSTHP